MSAVPIDVRRARRRVALAGAYDDAPGLLVQAVAVLRACPPRADLDHLGLRDPAQLPAGTADRCLLQVHEEVLGRPLEHTVTCPTCGESVTLPLGRADVGEHHPRSAWCGPASGVREPTYEDLIAAEGDAAVLLARCSTGTGATLDDLLRVEGSLSGPLHATCPGCGAGLSVDLDVLELVLTALSAVRADLDREVHLLAAGYGWDLAVIESLPDDRRSRLAALVAGGRP